MFYRIFSRMATVPSHFPRNFRKKKQKKTFQLFPRIFPGLATIPSYFPRNATVPSYFLSNDNGSFIFGQQWRLLPLLAGAYILDHFSKAFMAHFTTFQRRVIAEEDPETTVGPGSLMGIIFFFIYHRLLLVNYHRLSKVNYYRLWYGSNIPSYSRSNVPFVEGITSHCVPWW